MTAIRTLLSSNAPSLVLDVDHSSAAAEGRRAVAQIAGDVGLDETEAGKAAIVVNELATNLVKHTKGGSLFVHGARDVLDIVAIDHGPGVNDISVWMRDGYSSSGTAGNGLGAIRRLSTEFDIHSSAARGTAILARLHTAAHERASFRAGAFWHPLNIQDPCGDACIVIELERGVLCVLADGLGHGFAAAEASRAAIAVAANSAMLEPVRLLERMHAALRPTRGAAVAVAVIDRDQRKLRFAGLGNISASIHHHGASKSLVSLSGIAGHQARSFQEFVYDWPDGGTLVMHSDGLSSRWSFDQQPGLSAKHPGIIAAVLGRDFARERDDRCVVVVSEERR